MVINRFRISDFVEGRWFALADFGLVLISAALWFGWPELNAWPLLLGVMPWGIRIAAGYPPIRRTPLNIPLLFFVLTAMVGVWAAYDREAAFHKFWILVSAILLFYALANQPRSNLLLIVGIFGFLGFSVACYFLLSNDWGAFPAKFELIQRVADRWMVARPFRAPFAMHPNYAAGLMAMMTPFVLTVAQYARYKRKVLLTIIMVIVICVVMFGFWLTSSRGAWAALGAMFLAWVLWETSEFVADRTRLKRGVLFASAVSLALIVSFVLLLVTLRSFELLPSGSGYESLGSRLGLVRDTIFLIEDFAFTGGGLRSFPGLYSQYILVVPFYNLVYSHNTFLDAALEQGVGGGASLLAIFIITAFLLIRYLKRDGNEDQPTVVLTMALLGGLSVAFIHGLVDDVLYGDRGTPLLFLFPGLAVGLIYSRTDQNSRQLTSMGSLERIVRFVGQRKVPVIAVSVMLVLSLVFGLRKALLGTWHANMGAVGLARNELATWPTDEWSVMTAETELDSPEKSFHHALVLQPDQRTAHYRLGLIAIMRQEFSTAVSHLEQAYARADNHRGIKKTLAFSYVWQGEYGNAKALFADIPEAKDELSVYVWWWGTQGRSDLSIKAKNMLGILDDAG